MASVEGDEHSRDEKSFGGTEESGEKPQLAISWPFTERLMGSRFTNVDFSKIDGNPGVTIQTPHRYLHTAVRSPIVGTIEAVVQMPNGLLQVVLVTDQTDFSVILSRLTEVFPRVQNLRKDIAITPASVRSLSIGDMIGNITDSSDYQLDLQIAYHPRGSTIPLSRSQFLDPFEYLPPLKH